VRHQLDASRSRVGQLEQQLKTLQDGGGGRHKSPMDSKDQDYDMAGTVSRLRNELEVARRAKLMLEGQLLDRDARAVEARYEVEAREGEIRRLRRRVTELEEMREQLINAGGGHAGEMGGREGREDSDKGASRGPGARFQRERDLEGVVEGLNRVCDKLRAENERLRKGGGPEERKIAELEKRFAAEKKRADKLEEELAAAQTKLRSLDESGQKLVQRQQLIAQLRKQLKSREDELAAAVRRAEDAEGAAEGERRRAVASEGRAQTLEAQVLAVRSTASSAAKEDLRRAEAEIGSLKDRVAALQSDRDRLAASLRSAEQAALAVRGKDPGRDADAERMNQRETTRRLEEENNRLRGEASVLREENAKLKAELSAFDLDFFEEIENLKYAHAEAVRKLAVYEQGSGGFGTRFGGSGSRRS